MPQLPITATNQMLRVYHTPDYQDLTPESLVDAVLAYRDLYHRWPSHIYVNVRFQQPAGSIPNPKNPDPIGLDAMTKLVGGDGVVRVHYHLQPMGWEVMMADVEVL